MHSAIPSCSHIRTEIDSHSYVMSLCKGQVLSLVAQQKRDRQTRLEGVSKYPVPRAGNGGEAGGPSVGSEF